MEAESTDHKTVDRYGRRRHLRSPMGLRPVIRVVAEVVKLVDALRSGADPDESSTD